MKKILLTVLIGSFVIFLVGFGLRFSENILISDIGLWISFFGSLIMALVALFICIDGYRSKKQRLDNLAEKGTDKNDKVNKNLK